MKYRITETCEYELEADDQEQAEELYLEHGPAIDGDGIASPVVFRGVTNRDFEEAS